MARIAGVNIPTNKRVLIALQYIHGIGQKNAAEIVEKVKIPAALSYGSVPGLSNELKSRLEEIRPQTLGQAALLEGMTPAGLQAIRLVIRETGFSSKTGCPPAS